MILDALIVFGLGLFGVVLYAVMTVWKKIREEGFKWKKFVNDNKKFWFVGVVLHLLIAIATIIVPDVLTLLHSLGFAIEAEGGTGWVLLGIALAAGTDSSPFGKKLRESDR